MFGYVYKGFCRGNEVAIKVPTRRKLTKQQVLCVCTILFVVIFGSAV